eukprot:1661576-Amphidinium_carterae.1
MEKSVAAEGEQAHAQKREHQMKHAHDHRVHPPIGVKKASIERAYQHPTKLVTQKSQSFLNHPSVPSSVTECFVSGGHHVRRSSC